MNYTPHYCSFIEIESSWIIFCHCEGFSPKQSYNNVNEIATSGFALLAMTNNELRPPRNDKISSGIANPPFFVIANEVKQSYNNVKNVKIALPSHLRFLTMIGKRVSQ